MIPPINFSDFLDSYLIEDEIGSIVLPKSLEGQIFCFSIVFRVNCANFLFNRNNTWWMVWKNGEQCLYKNRKSEQQTVNFETHIFPPKKIFELKVIMFKLIMFTRSWFLFLYIIWETRCKRNFTILLKLLYWFCRAGHKSQNSQTLDALSFSD